MTNERSFLTKKSHSKASLRWQSRCPPAVPPSRAHVGGEEEVQKPRAHAELVVTSTEIVQTRREAKRSSQEKEQPEESDPRMSAQARVGRRASGGLRGSAAAQRRAPSGSPGGGSRLLGATYGRTQGPQTPSFPGPGHSFPSSKPCLPRPRNEVWIPTVVTGEAARPPAPTARLAGAGLSNAPRPVSSRPGRHAGRGRPGTSPPGAARQRWYA